MELTDILALVKAGYTRDEIAQMEPSPVNNPNPEPVPVAATEPVAEPKPTQPQAAEPVAPAVPVAQPTQAPAPAPAAAEPTMADLMQSIAKLTGAIQANAIAQSVIPGVSGDAVHAEDMLAEIIRPTFKERKP